MKSSEISGNEDKAPSCALNSLTTMDFPLTELIPSKTIETSGEVVISACTLPLATGV